MQVGEEEAEVDHAVSGLGWAVGEGVRELQELEEDFVTQRFEPLFYVWVRGGGEGGGMRSFCNLI